MFFLISQDYQSSLSIYPFPSRSGWHLLFRVVGSRLLFRARGTCFMFMPGCHTRWMTSPAQGLSTQSLSLSAQAFPPLVPGKPLPTFLAPTVAIRSRPKLHQKSRCPSGSRSSVLMASKENSWALSPLARLYSMPRNRLKKHLHSFWPYLWAGVAMETVVMPEIADHLNDKENTSLQDSDFSRGWLSSWDCGRKSQLRHRLGDAADKACGWCGPQ